MPRARTEGAAWGSTPLYSLRWWRLCGLTAAFPDPSHYCSQGACTLASALLAAARVSAAVPAAGMKG
jgi:hypothetical protein